MPNNTETYWEVDGQSLHTYARSIETIGGMGPAPFRGEDITIPLASGQMFVPKVSDSNTITLGMWLRGIDPSLGPGAVAASKARYQANYNDLVRQLRNPRKLVNLTKRFYDYSGGVPVLKTATAKAQYVGGLQPTMIGNNAGKCTVDMKLVEGFFYDDTWTSLNLVAGNNVFTVPGNSETTQIKITINGSRTNVTVTNSTLGVGVTYPRPLTLGKLGIIDAFTTTATEIEGSTIIDVSPSIIHSGAPQWMSLQPGVNTINLASDFGTGVVTIQAKGAWT